MVWYDVFIVKKKKKKALPLGGKKQFKLSVSLRDTSAQPGLEPTLC